MDYTRLIEEIKPAELLTTGFTVGSGVTIYYHEGLKKGISGADIFLLQGLMGGEWEKFKSTMTPVPTRDVDEFPEPTKDTNYGGWESGYIAAFTKAGIEFLHESEAWKGFDAIKAEVPLSDHVVLNELQRLAYQPLREAITLFVKKTEDGLIVNGKVQAKTIVPKADPPFYKPSYITHIPDLGIIKKMKKLCSQVDAVRFDDYALMYNKIVEATATHVLSSGNFAGQIGRIKKGEAVRAAMVKAVGGASDNLLAKAISAKRVPGLLFGLQIEFDDYQKIMRRRAPFAPRKAEATLYTDKITTLLFTFDSIVREDSAKLMVVNKTASSGQLFSPLKKESTTLWDAVLADWLMDKLLGCVKKKQLNMDMYTSMWNMYGSLFIPQTKNKMEIGERAKLKLGKECWRNYFVFNAFTQMPSQILFENIYTRWDKSVQAPTYKHSGNREIWSLLGWSCYGGGLEDLLRTMAQEARDQGYSLAIYSDNVYLLMEIDGKFYWFSLDGSSMECSLTKQDAEYFMKHVIEDYWEGQVTQAWRIYGEVFYKDLAVDGTALLGSLQWKNTGQFSGTGGTAYLNNAKMVTRTTVFDHLLSTWGRRSPLKKGRDLPAAESTVVFGERELDPQLDRAFFLGGVSLKVELVTQTSLFNVLLGEEIDLPDSVITLDLLGMDAAWIPRMGEIGGQKPIFPILNQDKLIRAVAYNKTTNKKSPKEERIIEAMRLKALYLLGAWRYEPLSALLRDRIGSNPTVKTARARVEKGEGLYEEMLEEGIKTLASELDPEAVGAIAQVLQSLALPYWYDVLTVYKSTHYAKAFLLKEFEDKGVNEALKIADVSTFSHTVSSHLGSLSKEKTLEWIEKLKSLDRFNELCEFLEDANEGVRGSDQSVADFKAWLRRIRGKLDVKPEDVVKWSLLNSDAQEQLTYTLEDIEDELDEVLNLGPTTVKPHESSFDPIRFIKSRYELKSFSNSNPKLIGSKSAPLSPELVELRERIIKTVAETGIPIQDLYNYQKLMMLTGLTVAEKDLIKKRATDFLVSLDKKLDQLLETTVPADATPSSLERDYIVKQQREERKAAKRDFKLEKQDRMIRDAEERMDRVKHEVRQQEKQTKRAKEKEKEEEEAEPPVILPRSTLHEKSLLHWVTQTLDKSKKPPAAPSPHWIPPWKESTPFNVDQAVKQTGELGDVIEEMFNDNQISIGTRESLLRILVWLQRVIDSMQIPRQKSEVFTVIKYFKDRLIAEKNDARNGNPASSSPITDQDIQEMLDLPFFTS